MKDMSFRNGSRRVVCGESGESGESGAVFIASESCERWRARVASGVYCERELRARVASESCERELRESCESVVQCLLREVFIASGVYCERVFIAREYCSGSRKRENKIKNKK